MANNLSQLLTGIAGVSSGNPISIHVDGLVTYIIYKYVSSGDVKGYPVKRVTETVEGGTYFDHGVIAEADRLAGSNGSSADVNLKTDSVNSLLLLTDVKVDYK